MSYIVCVYIYIYRKYVGMNNFLVRASTLRRQLRQKSGDVYIDFGILLFNMLQRLVADFNYGLGVQTAIIAPQRTSIHRSKEAKKRNIRE